MGNPLIIIHLPNYKSKSREWPKKECDVMACYGNKVILQKGALKLYGM